MAENVDTPNSENESFSYEDEEDEESTGEAEEEGTVDEELFGTPYSTKTVENSVTVQKLTVACITTF